MGPAAAWAAIALRYRQEFGGRQSVELQSPRIRVNRVLMWKSLAASLAMIALFFVGLPVPKVAILTGALLLITRRGKPGGSPGG